MSCSSEIRLELATELLKSAGQIRSVVRGGSMLPTIFPGDTLEIRQQYFEHATLGDVVLAMNRGHLCTHRVVREEFRANRRVLITRGDSLSFEDPDPVREEEFLGRVEFVIRRGRRFRTEMRHGCVSSAVQAMLQQSSNLRTGVLRFHSMLGRIIPRANVRFQATASGDAD